MFDPCLLFALYSNPVPNFQIVIIGALQLYGWIQKSNSTRHALMHRHDILLQDHNPGKILIMAVQLGFVSVVSCRVRQI